MVILSESAQRILDRIKAEPKGASHYRRYDFLFKIARQIRARMTERGMTVRELAEQMDTSPSQVQRMISLGNPSNLTFDSLLRAAEALGLEMEIKFREPGKSVSYVQRGDTVVRALSVHDGKVSCAPLECSPLPAVKGSAADAGDVETIAAFGGA